MPDYDSLIRAFREDTAAPRRPVRVAVRPSARAVPWGIAVGGFALAAVAALTVLPAAPIEGALASGALTPDVTLAVDGEGVASGTERDVRLAWAGGHLGVEVTPDRGVQLAVHTEEATVEVIGTGFDVTRDALGTAVDVRHGRVRVTCASGATSSLGVGERAQCLPMTAAGLLGRARALQARGAPFLADVEAALDRPDATGTVRDELLAVELDALVAGADPRAYGLAEELAARGGPRALDAHRVAARLASDCAGALPHLDALAAASALAADAPAYEHCRGAGAQR